jgi:hypothetical protein
MIAAVASALSCTSSPSSGATRQGSGARRFSPETSRSIGYHIAPGDARSGYRSGDETLALWALEAWRKASDGAIELQPAPRESALIQLYWRSGTGGMYGEVMPVWVGRQWGAAVFILPDTEALSQAIAKRAERDPLFRDVVVYLTCLHELGHAFGLSHSDDYEDIMYFFGSGGDVPRYFGRYRDKLQSREDIQKHSGLSQTDVRRLRELYPIESGAPILRLEREDSKE